MTKMDTLIVNAKSVSSLLSECVKFWGFRQRDVAQAMTVLSTVSTAGGLGRLEWHKL